MFDPIYQRYPAPEGADDPRIPPTWTWRNESGSVVRVDGATLRRNPYAVGWHLTFERSWTGPVAGGEVTTILPTNMTGDTITLRAREVGDNDDDSAVEYVDRVYPLAAPGPAVGQVWYDREAATEYMILVVTQTKHTVNGRERFLVGVGNELGVWSGPPDNSALIAGPGAPWFPAGWRVRSTEEEEEE